MYALVLLFQRPGFDGEPPEHEPFVDILVERGLVLLGGPVEPGGGAAYVLRCGSWPTPARW
ncbi:hypothetical protein [Blastococcus brunescens]|uniref:YCII-related domain-containing protein n=1 Tax=Blastococcus brunescens TaxID=1564165 RepID=A0ABZ1B400_9ACTN|nr:hypothetical protein [Blastococcus sp. BMG 8361]WRL65474.1 hypothetical protein U6N30_07615 [Blastococcus sp. BMG 8361]